MTDAIKPVWPPDLIAKLADTLRKHCTPICRWEEIATTALDFCADLDSPKISIPFRVGYVLGGLSNKAGIKAIYPDATDAQIDAAYRALWAIAGTAYRTEATS